MSTLGKRQRTFGTDWFYISYVFITLAIIVRIFLIGNPALDFWTANLLVLLGMLGVYTLIYVYARFKRPYFILYDNGIKVIDNNQEDMFYWTEITHFEGIRHTQTYNAIIIIKYGANTFCQGEKKLFKVSVWTMRAGTLVNFIISKLNEIRLPQLIETYESPKDINYANFWVNKEGIGNTNIWFKWDEIERVHMTHDDYPILKIKSIHDKKFKKLDHVLYGEQYSLLGLIDYVLGTAYLPEAQDYMMDYRQQFKDGTKMILKLATIVTIIMVGALVFVAVVRIANGQPVFSP